MLLLIIVLLLPDNINWAVGQGVNLMDFEKAACECCMATKQGVTSCLTSDIELFKYGDQQGHVLYKIIHMLEDGKYKKIKDELNLENFKKVSGNTFLLRNFFFKLSIVFSSKKNNFIVKIL